MRIAIASMMQETNTFSHLRTGYEDFKIAKGDEVYGWPGRSSVKGAIDALRAAGTEIVPAFFANALPGALIKKDAFETIRSEIVRRITDAGALDGICLVLHGSMAAEGYDDPEGNLLGALRKAVGWEIPICCSLDLHTTATEQMIRCANGYYAYHTAPHIDTYETGAKAADMLVTAIRAGKKMITRMVKLPVLIAGEQSETSVSPTRELMDRLAPAEKEPGVLGASYVFGYPWADSPYGGVAALVTGYAEAEATLADLASKLGEAFDETKTKFTFTTEAYPLEEAIDIALKEKKTPAVISDSGDNPTAGASQDLAIVAKAFIDRGIENSIVIAIADRAACEACEKAGVGARLDLDIGRLTPYAVSPASPLHVHAAVKILKEVDSTRYAVVECRGVTIVLSHRRVAVAEPYEVQKLGLKLENYRLLSVKCGYLDPSYKAFSGRSLLALTPGYTCELLGTLPYKRVPRPIFPLDR